MEDSAWQTDLSLGRSAMLFLHSLSVFVLAYLMVYFISGVSMLYIAYDLDIPARLFPSHTVFYLPSESPLWTTDSIVSVYLAPPVACLFIGLFALLVYQFLPRVNTSILFFVLWTFLHAFNRSFGTISEDLILKTDIHRVAAVFGFHKAIMVISIGFSLFFLLKAGIFSGKLLFHHFPAARSHTFNNRLKIWFTAMFIPFLAGIGLFLLRDLGSVSVKDWILYGFLLLMILPIPFTRPKPQTDDAECIVPSITQLLINIILAAIAFVAFTSFLHDGISFSSFAV